MLFRLLREKDGQGLLEAAFLVPAVVILVVNAVSIGYMFSVCLNLTTAAKRGAEYSVLGTSTVLQNTIPATDSVSTLVYENINTAVPSAANTPTRVCSVALGLTGAGSSQAVNCTTYGTGTGTFPDPQADPEAPYLLLHRVDVQYTVLPLLANSPFNFVPPVTFHRTVVMRAMP